MDVEEWVVTSCGSEKLDRVFFINYLFVFFTLISLN